MKRFAAFLSSLGSSAADCCFLALLSPLHSDQGNQLQQHLHLSRASQAAQGGSSHSVCQLRMPRMWKQRLNNTDFASSPATMHNAQHTIPSRRAQAPASSITLPAEKQRGSTSSRHTTISPSTTSHTGPHRGITVDSSCARDASGHYRPNSSQITRAKASLMRNEVSGILI